MTEVAVGFRIVGVDFQGLLVLGNSLVQLSLLKESRAKVAVGFRIVGVDFQGLLILGNSLVQLSLLKESRAKAVVAHPAIRILGQRIGPECLLAFINASPLPTRHPDDQQQSSTK